MVNNATTGNDERYRNFYSILNQKLQSHRHMKRYMDRFLSTDFNVFKVIRKNENRFENRLSEIIADLLNPDGSHGQQRIFLDAFLRITNPPDLNSLLKQQPRSVICECRTDQIERSQRRIDILVDFENFGFGIENKIRSGDQECQLKDYGNHLEGKYKNEFCLVYLTQEGRNPSEDSIEASQREKLKKERKLICVSYRDDILKWLEECCQLCESDKFRWFLRDFTNYIPTITMEESMSISSKRKIIVEHALENKENLENTLEVHGAYDDLRKRILEGFWEDLQGCLEKHLDSPQWEFIKPEDPKDLFGFAKLEWKKKYKIVMQLHNKTVWLGICKDKKERESIKDLVKTIDVGVKGEWQGRRDDWWEYYFGLGPSGSEVLVKMQFNRDVIKEQVCKELVRISKIPQAMQLIDEKCRE